VGNRGRLESCGRIDSLHPVAAGFDVTAFACQEPCQSATYIDVVIDDKDAMLRCFDGCERCSFLLHTGRRDVDRLTMNFTTCFRIADRAGPSRREVQPDAEPRDNRTPGPPSGCRSDAGPRTNISNRLPSQPVDRPPHRSNPTVTSYTCLWIGYCWSYSRSQHSDRFRSL
jgi:hypothetical protein